MELATAETFIFAESLGGARALFEQAKISPRISIKKFVPQLRARLLEVRNGCQTIVDAAYRFLDAEDEHTEEKLQQALALLIIFEERMKRLFHAAKPITEGPLRRYVKDFPFRVWEDIREKVEQVEEVQEIIAESLSKEFRRELVEAKNAVLAQSGN
jgi:hypothetical protein